MDSALPLLLFFGLLLGMGVLILACGIKAREDERGAVAADPRRRQDLLAGARMFAARGRTAHDDPVAVLLERSDLERVVELLRVEIGLMELVADDSRVEHADGRETRESLLERLERFLDREQALVAEFVSNPSIARLYEGGETVAAVP